MERYLGAQDISLVVPLDLKDQGATSQIPAGRSVRSGMKSQREAEERYLSLVVISYGGGAPSSFIGLP